MYIILSFVFMGLITTQDATEPIELFGYENPPHEDQVLEVSKLAHVILQRAQWKRNFNSEACPELTHEVCPEGQVCYPPTAPPPYPPNVCDLPEYMFDSDCAPDAECTDPTKCPVPLCIIESTRRVPVEGAVDCIPEDCKEGGQYYGTEHCRPVTRCDLTYWVDVLEECKSNPPNACQTYPHLCVNFCDITGDYSPCGYTLCYQYPQLEHCSTLPSPPSCNPGQETDPNRTCCVGTECYEGFKRCKWGYSVGVRVSEVLNFDNSVTESSENNINTAECLAVLSVLHKQPLSFKCFEDGVLPEGWRETTEDQFDEIVAQHTQEGDVVTYQQNDDTKERIANLENNESINLHDSENKVDIEEA